MNTEEYILIKNTDIDVEKIELPDFSKEEINIIEGYIEFTRHIQEIDQLFHIFKVNLNEILIHYELINDDTIYRKIELDNEESDSIIINALVINYISSAKTFTESIENFIENKLGENELNEFKSKCLSKIYDEKFSYRLLIRLRDFSQHGHLPVFISADNKCSFDLEQILYTPHFNHNKKLENEMKKIAKKISKEFETNPRIMFTRSIAEFEISILEIYKYFINIITEKLNQLTTEFNNIIDVRPEIIHTSKDSLNGFILYSIKDENINCVNPKQKPQKMVEMIGYEIDKLLKNVKKEFGIVFKMKEIKEIRL